MAHGDPGHPPTDPFGRRDGGGLGDGRALAEAEAPDPASPGQVVETTVSPFHCLYQDALWLHTQARLRLPRSESEAGRLCRASLLLYLQAAEALVHQAAVEIGRPELAHLIADPSRPMPLRDAWALLPAVAAEEPPAALDPDGPPWPQFLELLALRDGWTYPGLPSERRAYYAPSADGSSFEPLDPRAVPPGLCPSPDRLRSPRTGLPRDPYALRPHHLDTARGVLDQAIAALDRRLDGALTRDARHRKEPCRILPPRPLA
ncbi:hypothetical protein [Tautonia plasticadhaerens]|uniref:Uncharacterized protein n=1 Tax=Tautonia plasticadhaerens TaxID=2527974 RepID=A0A518H4R2_9BACT|nr:hypothetical protein [Tautonia plasticadhaerens]QDV35797.1 hypothetical protein ElP_37050 [Tautonia plasticadhaerens]